MHVRSKVSTKDGEAVEAELTMEVPEGVAGRVGSQGWGLYLRSECHL
jgi:hypothetical protein